MKKVSQKKQNLIDEVLNKPVKAGDFVYVRGLGSQDKKSWCNTTKVMRLIENDSILIEEHDSLKSVFKEDWKHYLGNVGANPFPKVRDNVRNINFPLSSVLFQLGLIDGKSEYDIDGIKIQPCNFNPHIIDGDEKKIFYQRSLVWEVEDKVNLIDSIYNGIDCGKILVRSRSWEELQEMLKQGETELFWKDVVDGKQRLNAVVSFINDEFQDSRGNYYSDLSDTAQHRLLDHQLFSYSELPENSKDSDVREQFLKLNFAGVPQSKEHIEFIKSIKV